MGCGVSKFSPESSSVPSVKRNMVAQERGGNNWTIIGQQRIGGKTTNEEHKKGLYRRLKMIPQICVILSFHAL